MNTVTGNKYGTDFGSMDSRDPMSLLARSSTHTRCPDIAGNPVPGHVVPGASFAAYHGFYQTEALGAYDDTIDISDLNTSCQLLQEDWAMERAWNIQNDQLIGQQCPLVTSDFELDSAREIIMPFYGTPDLPPVLGNFRDPWTENPDVSVGSFNFCDSPMEESAVAEHIHWDILNPLEPSFGAQSILYNLYEDVGHLPCATG
ncbi:hypothetical protein J3R83DRAFT_12203 [Lanmaoa asiatica]|nr:hypothetical protein J3R83DRAFT_12203 [Lanmaoa asiatica]